MTRSQPQQPQKRNIVTRVLKGAAYAVSYVIFPIFETKLMLRVIAMQAARRSQDIRNLFPPVDAIPPVQDDDEMTWERAVRASGVSVEALNRNYRRRQKVWRSMFTVCLLLMITGLVYLFITPVTVPRVSFIFSMFCGAMIALAKATGTAYRLWQLHSHRVSLSERGTFRHFLNERDCLTDALGLPAVKVKNDN